MSRPTLENVNIASRELVLTPREIHEEYPMSASGRQTVLAHRRAVERILLRQDARVLVVVGPCSVHDPEAALEYAGRLSKLAARLNETLLIVMRVYFEKPRTVTGWKGFINDPHLDGSFRLDEGLRKARELLVKMAELGVGVGTEALDPITPQYLGDLVSWFAIGARTSESQTHREMASGLSAPVGFKNGTDGSVRAALNGLQAASHPQHFFGVTEEGRCAVFRTRGNPHGHLILRGGKRPNYDSVSVAMCEAALHDEGIRPNIVIDCSHGNSLKKPELQPLVLDDCVNQIRDGNRSIIGFMLESNLEAGRQDLRGPLRRGVSITDACIGWDATVEALEAAHDKLAPALRARASEQGAA